MQKDSLIKEIYYDVKNPSSFGTAKALHTAINNTQIDLKYVKNWLQGQIPATLHKARRKKFKRNPTVVDNIDEQWRTDLVDVTKFSRQNSGFKYIVTTIDIFSKFAWAFPIKNKKPEGIVEGFKEIFKSRIPLKIQSDQGLEFSNRKFGALLKENNILYFTTRNTEIKCALVERFNKTLRNRMFKYFTSKGTHKYSDILKHLLTAYNGRFHSSIGMAPKDVTTEDTKTIFKRLYGFDSRRDMLIAQSEKPKIAKGADVRISYQAEPFDKGYYPNWTDETFKVKEAIKGTTKAQYQLQDLKGETIEGRFYPEEVQKVESDIYRIQVIKYRTRQGKREAFVRWLNYPESENRWIPEEEVSDI